eukprot:m.125392 g.125392  ORF g.125392 m.125392 type:complete len:185 (-) comp23461_c0_seq3:625-1179(-)
MPCSWYRSSCGFWVWKSLPYPSFVVGEGLHVTGIERQEDLTKASANRAAKVEKFVSKRHARQEPAPEGQAPSLVTLEVDVNHGAKDIPCCHGAVLAGLHTCGDLGPMSLRLFLNSHARAIVNVGCCYHAMSEREHELFGERQEGQSGFVRDDQDVGFPLSNAAKRFCRQTHCTFKPTKKDTRHH